MTETTTPGAAVDLAELAWPPALTPYLGVADARSALDWYVEVFHAERRGEPIHAGRQHRARRAGHRGRGADDRRGLSGGRRDRAAPGEGTSVSIFVQVPDADAAVQRAVDRGAELIRPVADQPYGRSGVIRDPRGVAEDIHTACKQSELPTSIERVFDNEAAAFAPPVNEDGGACPEWSAYLPDGLLASILGEQPADGIPGFERLERIGGWERIIAWAQANQLTEISRFVSDGGAGSADSSAGSCAGASGASEMDSAVAEVGLMLGVSRRSADQRVADAVTLTDRLPATLAALRGGLVKLTAARAIAEETANLSAEHTAAVEHTVLGRIRAKARSLTPGEVRAATRRAVLVADPDAARQRHAHARRDRGVRLFDQPDGMATLAGYLDAGDAVGIYGLLDAYARQAARDDRTMDARRADALVDLVFGSAGRASANAGDHCTGSEGSPTDTGQAGPRQSDTTERATPDSARGDDLSGVRRSGRPASRVHAQVRLTVPASMVLGLDDEPAYLAGYGYIPADAARELAADGVWRRIVTDPLTGALLDYGTTRYAPPPSLAEYVIARDQRCVFPGCRVPAHRCDLDHREPHDPRGDTGRTSADNLDAQCRAHPF